MVRFESGEDFSLYQNSAAATCSFLWTCSSRQVLLNNLAVWSDLSNATITIQASGTTKWGMCVGSAAVAAQYAGLTISNDGAQTLSCNVTASGSAVVSVCGIYKLI